MGSCQEKLFEVKKGSYTKGGRTWKIIKKRVNYPVISKIKIIDFKKMVKKTKNDRN